MAWLPALDRKLLRELWAMKGQVITIAVVLGSGVASFLMLRGVYVSLEASRDAYYERNRFADVFATVEHAPESLAARIEALPGVARVQTRVAEDVTLPIEGMPRPAYGRLLSLPASGESATNALHLLKGRLPARGPTFEVVVLEPFARAHGLEPGHRLPAILNGRLEALKVVGIALSPEFVYAIRPGSIADDPKRYTVLWMERTALAAAFDRAGAFNDVSLLLQPGASEAAVIAGLDRLLARYGSDGAYGRRDQRSNQILTRELDQLEGLATMIPLVFLGVATFLIRLVLGRLVTLQRQEIAMLKAVGYSNRRVGTHYLGLVVVVLVPAALLGVGLGRWLGGIVLALYAEVFNFPEFALQLDAGLIATGLSVSAAGALLGALVAVRAAVRLPPAEAMRPPSPARYRRGVLSRAGLDALPGPVGLMVLRESVRRPLRTVMSSLGIAGAVSLLVLARFGVDSLDRYFEGIFAREQRQDLTVTFNSPVSPRVVDELGRSPGVVAAEGLRAVPVRARHGPRARDAVLMGLEPNGTLQQLIDRGTGAAVPLPREGLLLSRKLGEVLGLEPGDLLRLELKEGERKTVQVEVAGFIDDTMGLRVYATAGQVAALVRDEGAVSQALVRVAPGRRGALEARLADSPRVLETTDLRAELQRTRDLNAKAFDVWMAVSVLLASVVILGVVYNNARIALTARSRELASLRVLGFKRSEVSRVLLGGLAVEVALAIPLGLALGRLWAQQFSRSFDQETFRFTAVVAPRTYLLATFVALVAAAVSAFWVRRSLDRLDLIAVLKTRE